MRNPSLLPYETIVRATSGEPEAVDEVLRHYSKRIRIAALAYAEVISYNKKNLERELQNESRQHNRQQSRPKRREEEI